MCSIDRTAVAAFPRFLIDLDFLERDSGRFQEISEVKLKTKESEKRLTLQINLDTFRYLQSQNIQKISITKF